MLKSKPRILKDGHISPMTIVLWFQIIRNKVSLNFIWTCKEYTFDIILEELASSTVGSSAKGIFGAFSQLSRLFSIFSSSICSFN